MQGRSIASPSTSMATRVAFWGPTIAGFLAVVLAISAALESEWVGAGVCLVAAALAFGVIAYAFVKE